LRVIPGLGRRLDSVFAGDHAGLEPHAFERRLNIVNPDLPPFITWLELRRLRVGQAIVDLRFERDGNGTLSPHVTNLEGDLEIVTGRY
jgi:hypothetical protein